jgi:hypothetical protein
MAKQASAKKKDKISKKEFRKEVIQKLTDALAVYKQELGEKKFESRVKQAGKLFSRNIEKIFKKKNDRKTKPKKQNLDGVPVQGVVVPV